MSGYRADITCTTIRTDIRILDIPPWSFFRFNDFVRLLNEMLDEHFGGNRYHKGSIVRAALDIVVRVYNLLDTCH
jgi:hypothetical protein